MKQKLLIRIAYLGTNYCGYQVQPNGPSVQAEINRAAEALFGHPCDIVGCSRTDSGVHANGFCATVAARGTDELRTDIPAGRVPQALSAHLPDDIRVFAAEWVPSGFHARYDVQEKEYLYRIYNRRVFSPFEVGRAWHVPQEMDAEALARMKAAASAFPGTRDFSAFMAKGSKVTDPVRTVTRAEVTREGDLVLFRVAANGFLYNMVRIMVGTLVDVAQGRLDPADLPDVIASRDRDRAGQTAPACGLYLDRVTYPVTKNSQGFL